MASPSSEVDIALAAIQAGRVPCDLETETLDFKEDRASDSDTERLLAEAAICFANTAGGTIVLGVADRIKGPAALIGTQLEPLRIKQRIFELTRPSLVVEVERLKGHANVLAIKVPQSPGIHADTQGRAYRRIATSCLPMDPDQQQRLREERGGSDWSALPSDAPVEAAIPEAIRAARHMLLTLNDDRRTLAALNDRDLFSALGVLSDDGRLNRAGKILFCASEARGADTVLYQFRATPGGESQSIERLRNPAILAFARTLELIGARQVLTPVTLPNGQQIHIENFPSLAVREALSNALVHRDYHLSAPIAIEHAPEVFKVSSPGPLVAGVTPHNILTVPSRPRNRALAKAARTLGLAEETGRGVDRMYREMIRSGRPLPTIASDFDAVSVVLVGDAPDTNIARFVAGLPEQERDDTDTMIVLFQLCATRTLTALLAAPLLQKTPEEAQAILARLSSDAVGLLERTRQSLQRSAATYRLRGEPLRLLGPAVKYNRRSTTETDRKIIAHVQEYEKITNRTLQNFFDLDVYKARDMIADLVARGLLVRVSAQPRGPGVEWGPGPKFPVKKSRLRKIVPPADSDQGTLL